MPAASSQSATSARPSSRRALLMALACLLGTGGKPCSYSTMRETFSLLAKSQLTSTTPSSRRTKE